tara:strand:+ start:46 stop:201 length:156 start_codon:yes stop_codon:yes gene_type:complete
MIKILTYLSNFKDKLLGNRINMRTPEQIFLDVFTPEQLNYLSKEIKRKIIL